MVKITIDTRNSAFDDGNCGYETARILRKVADDFEQNTVEGLYPDINGNFICEVQYKK